MDTEPIKIDFSGLINDLLSAGLSITEIAKRADTSQPNISRLKNGYADQPLYFLGSKLIKLHQKEMRIFRQRMAAAARNNVG